VALAHVQPDAEAAVALTVLLPHESLPFVRGRRGDLAGTQGDLEAAIAASGVSCALSAQMMPDSSERALSLCGPRVRVDAALQSLAVALEQFMKHGDLDMWLRHVPPSTRSSSSSSSSSSSVSSASSPLAASVTAMLASRGLVSSASGSVVPALGDPVAAAAAAAAGAGIQSNEALQVAMSVPVLSAAVSGTANLPQGQIQVEISIPHASAGAVIGRGGSMIAEVMRQSGTQVKVSDSQVCQLMPITLAFASYETG
jgi:predicted RNA-binding protein YlqC (UPF0109 family)